MPRPKNLVLIRESKTFMVNALQMNLEKEEYRVTAIGPTIDELDDVKELADVFIYYLDKNIDDYPDFLVYLKDFITETEKDLVTIGELDEYESFNKLVPEDLISLKILRPIDFPKLMESLAEIMEKNDEYSRKKSILLVDDDGAFLKACHDWLSDDYRVTIVSSGMQAITWLANNTPDLILLDYEMPVTPGPKVLEMIRSESNTRNLPVIFLTSKNDRESVMSVMAFKPDGYLLKTMTKDQLKKNLAEFFESRKYKF
ncbi:MAG: response regulator [Lachnospiraceae bacterium]|nr:response regulator [Lachnospiraceae bacterium]